MRNKTFLKKLSTALIVGLLSFSSAVSFADDGDSPKDPPKCDMDKCEENCGFWCKIF